MDKKYGEFVGVDSCNFAKVTKDDATGYTAEVPRYLAPAAEIAGEPETNTKTTYYDNQPGFNYVTEGKTELKVTISGIPAQLAAELLGKLYDAATGRVYDSGQPNPPEVALGFRYAKGQNDFRYYWYHKGTFSGGAEEGVSKKNDVEVKTYQLTYTAVVTTKTWDVDGTVIPLKRVFADTTDELFDPIGWFEQVQTPDKVGAPVA